MVPTWQATEQAQRFPLAAAPSVADWLQACPAAGCVVCYMRIIHIDI
jgi:hypothetical protein